MNKFFVTILLLISSWCFIHPITNVLLMTSGEKTFAMISYSERQSFTRSTVFTTHYRFTTDSKEEFTGSCSIAGHGISDEPHGTLNILYLKSNPNINARANMTELIFYAITWLIAGFLFFVWAVKTYFRKRNSKKELEDAGIDDTSDDSIQRPASAAGFLFILLIVSGITYFFTYGNTKNIIESLPMFNTPPVLFTDFGNTYSSALQSGMFACSGDQIAFSNYSDKQKLYIFNKRTKNIQKVNDDAPFYINFYKGYIYYSSFHDNKDIYRVKPDGTDKKRVTDSIGNDIIVANDIVLFSNGNSLDNLYKVSVNGGSEKRLTNDKTSNIIPYKDFIYYINENDSNTIYKIRSNGKGRTQVTKFGVTAFIIENDKILYIAKDSMALMSSNLDGTAKAILINTKVSNFYLSGGQFYTLEPNMIKVYDISGKARDMIPISASPWFIGIFDNIVLMSELMDNTKSYYLDLSEKKLNNF